MKPLPPVFDQNSFHFRQLQRTETHALYEKTLKSNGRVSDYEVIKIRKCPAGSFVKDGKEFQVEAKESFPPSEQWGVNGWTFLDLESAKKRFYEITN